jgi:hypothetical protein
MRLNTKLLFGVLLLAVVAGAQDSVRYTASSGSGTPTGSSFSVVPSTGNWTLKHGTSTTTTITPTGVVKPRNLQLPVDSNTVALWRMDSAGTSVSNAATVNYSPGNTCNQGVNLQMSPSMSATAGKVNNALSFPASGTNGAYWQCFNTDNSFFTVFQNDFSIDAWVYHSAASSSVGARPIFTFWGSGGTWINLYVERSTDVITATWRGASGFTQSYAVGDGSCNLDRNTITHVALTMDITGSNVVARIYKNGTLCGTSGSLSKPEGDATLVGGVYNGGFVGSDTNANIGGTPTAANTWEGWIDEVRISSTVRSTAELLVAASDPALGTSTEPWTNIYATTATTSALNVTGTATYGKWYFDTGATHAIYFGATAAWGSSDPLIFTYNGAEAMRLNSNGLTMASGQKIVSSTTGIQFGDGITLTTAPQINGGAYFPLGFGIGTKAARFKVLRAATMQTATFVNTQAGTGAGSITLDLRVGATLKCAITVNCGDATGQIYTASSCAGALAANDLLDATWNAGAGCSGTNPGGNLVWVAQ